MKRLTDTGSFPFPMTQLERILGWIYLVLHIFVMTYAADLVALVLESGGASVPDGYRTHIYFFLAFLFCAIALFRYLRLSAVDLGGNILNCLRSLPLCFLLYYVLAKIFAWLLSLLLTGDLPALSSLVTLEMSTKLNPGVLPLVAALLAPVAEEVLFRGVAFGTLRRRSRVLAYVVSILLFGFYHLWDSFLFAFDWRLFLYLLQYVPAGFVLALCYDQSKSIWGPVLLHVILNFVTVTISIG